VIGGQKVLFYCHYPDKLLSTKRDSGIMKFYRFFLDLLEEISTGMAHKIVVNSEFTRGVFKDNFPLIAENEKINKKSWMPQHLPAILYPPINLATFEKSKNFS
jgi:alpha-1,3/alpha-1,6-mannosyltransferase